MTIQIDGTNTLNKGAELMLYAVLEEIEKSHPEALVYYNSNYAREEKLNIPSSLKIKKRLALHYGKYPSAILRRLKLPYVFFTSKHPMDNIDLVLDAGGFQFSDQWNYSNEDLIILEKYYKELKNKGSKIVFLSQAFGPFKTNEGKKSIEIINKYADLIIARERISYKYLLEAGGDKNKILMYSDFTLSVKGKLPEEYDFVKGKVCVIPNQKMITHTKTGSSEYVDFMEQVIYEIQKKGKEVFFLNHEGKGDFDICNQINAKFENKLQIVSGLNSKEVKGVIGASFMVVSSRFHGVASALNQGVPCLATSWNHKYEMLFEDFNQRNRILDVKNNITDEILKINEVYRDYDSLKQILKEAKSDLKKENIEMWSKVWSLME